MLKNISNGLITINIYTTINIFTHLVLTDVLYSTNQPEDWKQLSIVLLILIRIKEDTNLKRMKQSKRCNNKEKFEIFLSYPTGLWN